MPESKSRMARLRAGTQDAHARVETAPALTRLVAQDLTHSEYIVILQHLHALYTHLEPIIAAELETLPMAAAMLDGTRPRRLAEDLAWFKAPALASPPLPVLAGPAAALGALYVIEGSSLGGRIIGRHVSNRLGVTPMTGGSFFCGLDADTARQRWARLGAILDNAVISADPAEPGRDDAVVASARKMFGFIERCFRRIKFAVPSSSVMTNVMAR